MVKNCIIEFQSGASFHVRRGWSQVLQSIGYNVIEYWMDKGHVVNDIFNQFGHVDLFLGTTYNLNRPLIKQILNRPEMKVALYCSGWGKICNEIDLKEYPIQVVSNEEKKNVELIKDRIGCCHIHIPDSRVYDYIGGWTDNLGIPVCGIMNAANLFVYDKAQYKEKYRSDIGFCGSIWPYKAKTLNKYLVRYCREYWRNTSVKVYGAGWDIPQNLGNIEFGEDAHVFASSKICPNISEGHSYIFPDIVERVFKTPVAGGFCISDNVDLSETGLQDVVPQFKEYDEFVSLIDYYLKNEDKRLELLDKQKQVIYERHTYHHRIRKLLSCIGLQEDAEKACDNIFYKG